MMTTNQETRANAVFPQGCLRTTRAGVRDIRKHSVMPIYMKIDGEESGRITTSARGSVLLHEANAGLIPAGEYLIFVYSRLDAAYAAGLQHEFYGLSHYTESSRTISGDGVLIVKSHMPAMCNKVSAAIGPDLSICHKGENGVVSINIIDFRDAPSHQNIQNPPLVSSLTLPANLLHAHLDSRNGHELPQNEIERGEKIARSIVREGLRVGALRVLQDRLEDIPGARIATSGASAFMVTDHIEDIIDEVSDEGLDAFDLPPLLHIHRELYAITRFGHMNGSEVCRGLAERIVSRARAPKS